MCRRAMAGEKQEAERGREGEEGKEGKWGQPARTAPREKRVEGTVAVLGVTRALGKVWGTARREMSDEVRGLINVEDNLTATARCWLRRAGSGDEAALGVLVLRTSEQQR